MTTLIHQPHDKLFKQAMADTRVAIEFFQSHLPAHILQKVDFSSLKLEKESFIDDNYKSSEADVLYSVNIENTPAYFYLLCEHQSAIDQHMSLRLFRYMLNIFDRHRKKIKKGSLPLIYPIVIYTGEKTWNAPRTLFKLFGEHEQLAKNILLNPFQIIELQKISDHDLKQRLWSGLVEFVLKYRKVQDFADYLDTLFPWLRIVEFHEGAQYAKVVLKYVLDDLDHDEEQLIVNKAEQHLSKKLEDEVMTLAERFEQRGYKKGIQQGMQQGMQQGAKQTKLLLAKSLLTEGFSEVNVARLTGLELEALQVFNRPQNID